jgi:hypothetical protein
MTVPDFLTVVYCNQLESWCCIVALVCCATERTGSRVLRIHFDLICQIDSNS